MSTNKNKDFSSKSYRFRHFLSAFNLKQNELKEKIGINQEAVSFIVNGKRDLKMFHALALQATYGVSAEWLLHGHGEMMQQGRSPRDPQVPKEATQQQTESLPMQSGNDEVLHEVRSVGSSVDRVDANVIDLRSGIRNMELRITILDDRVTRVEQKVEILETRGKGPIK